MNPGDIADGWGNLWVLEQSHDADGALTPSRLGKVTYGRVWVTPNQADVARMWGWRTIQETSGLVVIERSEIEARMFLAEPAKA